MPKEIGSGHEKTDASAKGIMWFGIGFIVTAVILHFVLGGMFNAVKNHDRQTLSGNIQIGLLEKRQPAPEPHLQSDPSSDFQQYLKKEESLLSTYGWVDPKAGIARIPIEKAMDLLVSRSGRSHE